MMDSFAQQRAGACFLYIGDGKMAMIGGEGAEVNAQGYIDLSGKVEKILKGSLDSIPSPLPLVKIQIMGGKICFRCKGKTLLCVVNKLLKTKSLLTSPSDVVPFYLK